MALVGHAREEERTEAKMKLINVLMAAWVATTAASNEDDPSSLDNEVRYLLTFYCGGHEWRCHHRISSLHSLNYLCQDGSRQGVVTEVYIDSNGEATFADENFEVCGEDQETCHYWGDDGLWNYYCAAVSFISVPQLPYSKCLIS